MISANPPITDPAISELDPKARSGLGSSRNRPRGLRQRRTWEQALAGKAQHSAEQFLRSKNTSKGTSTEADKIMNIEIEHRINPPPDYDQVILDDVVSL